MFVSDSMLQRIETRRNSLLARIAELLAVEGIDTETAEEWQDAAREYDTPDDLNCLAEDIADAERDWLDSQLD